MIPAIAAVIVFTSMIAEARISWRHDRVLRAAGAIEPTGDVYALMQVAYPAAFVAMILEAAVGRSAWTATCTAGVVLFVAAKALKYWAIHALGHRWTFRVLVPAGQPRITTGPYRWLRHPNYLAVAGELAGAALWLRAVFTGPIAFLLFGALMIRRIRVEERALAG